MVWMEKRSWTNQEKMVQIYLGSYKGEGYMDEFDKTTIC